MANNIKEKKMKINLLLHRNTTDKVRRISQPIQEYMSYSFNLSYTYLNDLRCFETEGEVDGQKLKNVYIFNPSLAYRKKVLIRSVKDLELRPELLLFSGFTDKQNNVTIRDRRIVPYNFLRKRNHA